MTTCATERKMRFMNFDKSVLMAVLLGTMVVVIILYSRLLSSDDIAALKNIVTKEIHYTNASHHRQAAPRHKKYKLYPPYRRATPKPKSTSKPRMPRTTPSVPRSLSPSNYSRIECTKEIRKKSNDMCDTIERLQVTAKEKKVYLDILQFVLELARKKGWTHFVTYGTLLGSWRHHGFIPYDVDVDMYFDLKVRRDLIYTIESQTEYVVKQILPPHQELKVYSNSRSHVDYYVGGLGRWRGPYMDIYFYKIENNIVKCITFQSQSWLKSEIFPLRTRPFERLTVPVPNNPLKVLQKIYGKTSKCSMRDGKSRRHYECRNLDGVIPFVHRKFANGTFIETLKLGSKILHVRNVTETVENLPKDPFTLDDFHH